METFNKTDNQRVVYTSSKNLEEAHYLHESISEKLREDGESENMSLRS